ncbi:MAG: hypothetical protein K6G03_02690 [Lachnospiraceae bacterium]|nr:hypothetical protein [Lachnospiraceae bacterium]
MFFSGLFNKNTKNTVIKRHGGSFLAMFLLSCFGIFAVAAPLSITSSLKASVDKSLDERETSDLILDSEIGFTAADVAALQDAEYIETVSIDPTAKATVSQDNALAAASIASRLYVYLKNAKEMTALTDEYTDLVDDSAGHIINEIEPIQSAARLQALNKNVQEEIDRLNKNLTETVNEETKLEEDSVSYNASYEKKMAEYEKQQETINEAKEAIQASEKNAQTNVEGAKQNLTRILNEVYSKSVVTASDIQKAQGASNYAGGTEKNYHNQFTNQWSKLSESEVKLHDEENALEEEKEKHDQEVSNEKQALTEKETDINSRLESLQGQLVTEAIHWTISNRLIIPEYHAAAENIILMNSRLLPIGLILYACITGACIVLSFRIIKKNRSRIDEWLNNGLSDHIIAELFVRRSALSVFLGALAGLLLGSVITPLFYIYAGTIEYDLSSISLSPSILIPVLLLIFITAMVSLSSLISYHVAANGIPKELIPAPIKKKPVPAKNLNKDEVLQAINEINNAVASAGESDHNPDELNIDKLP